MSSSLQLQPIVHIDLLILLSFLAPWYILHVWDEIQVGMNK
jgi:hypothetical protein